MLEGLTAPFGFVDLNRADDTLHWVRWRLAHDLHHRFHVSIGVEVRADFFEPLDGDLYSLPVWSPACRRPTYFGRLSPGAVRVSHAEDAEFLCPGFRNALRGTSDLNLEAQTASPFWIRRSFDFGSVIVSTTRSVSTVWTTTHWRGTSPSWCGRPMRSTAVESWWRRRRHVQTGSDRMPRSCSDTGNDDRSLLAGMVGRALPSRPRSNS